MKDFISGLTNSYSKFLSEITTKNKENISGSLISFSKELPSFNLKDKLYFLLNSSADYFYFTSPDHQMELFSSGKVFSIIENGQGRFASTDKKIKDISSRFICNWKDGSYPVFVGAMKFTVEHSDDVWKDYNNSEWFVPETLFFKNSNKTHLILNYFADQGLSKNKLAERLKDKIEKIFSAEAGNANKSFPRIVNASGISPKDKKKWKQTISQVLEKINNNEVKKAVIARKVELNLSGEIDVMNIIDSLIKDYSNCYIYAYRSGNSVFFGATPELLTKCSSGRIEVDAIAGSVERGKSTDEDIQFEKNLLSNAKDLEEHRYVLDQLKTSLNNIADNIEFNEKPSVKKLKNIQHLVTKMTASLKNETSIMTILKELHPTPAVCGFPKEAALDLIKKLENQRRGLYSGIIGWFNLNCEGEFAVAIRSAITSGNKLTAFAGGGIVSSSEPDSEFEETQIKLKPILSLFDEKY